MAQAAQEEMTKRVIYVAVNENGHRIGQSHSNATVSDETIDLIRELREDQNLTYIQIAKKLGLNKEYVAKVCRYERRAYSIARWRKVIINE